MRIFKYLVLIVLSFISVNTFAQEYEYRCTVSQNIKSTMEECGQEQIRGDIVSLEKCEKWTSNTFRCLLKNKNNISNWYSSGTILPKQLKCPSPNVIISVKFNDMSHIPLRTCTEIAPDKFCATVGNESTVSGGGTYLGKTFSPSILHQSLSETPQSSCTPLFSDSTCDSSDPYGGCYVPPDDGCTRHKDGSIYCPPEAPPPQPEETCNGATYCKAPPEGCGEGYVRGSFNGQELCVKSGPSNPPKPDNPDDPDNCANGGSYCPAPPNDDSCPDGYYPTTHNGSKICVKNNPNPNEPNPNDPNNNNGGDNGGGDNGGDNGGDGDTGGTGVDLSKVIDAIKALRDALLQALGSLSQKLSTLINGQKETNEHLDDIKEESVKTNVKLDKVNENITTTNSKLDIANEHLNAISDHTAAASEAIGITNKKLDSLKDAVEGSYKCENESYDPNDKNSKKYRECTKSDITATGDNDTKVSIDSHSINPTDQNNQVRWSSVCPVPVTQTVPLFFGYTFTYSFEFDSLCTALSRISFYFVFAAYLAAAFIIAGVRNA